MISNTSIQESLTSQRDGLPSHAAIAGWVVETGRDATGDDAVWVWVVLHDELIQKVWPLQTRNELREKVRELVQSAASPTEVQVYVRFRSETEQRGLSGGDWSG